jgi:manganese-dependent ADP-ribose/CDP-alcohol diphosphatase
MCHFPIWPENEHNLLNYNDVLSILEKYDNIIAWFAGHNHPGNYGNFNMIHFVTMKGMVETEEANSCAIVEVYKNKIWIKGYGREKSQILAY